MTVIGCYGAVLSTVFCYFIWCEQCTCISSIISSAALWFL